MQHGLAVKQPYISSPLPHSLEILAPTNGPGQYAPGLYVCCMILEQYTFQIWSSMSLSKLEYSSRLLMVQDHIVLSDGNFQILI